MTNLDPAGVPIDLGGGVVLRTPGLQGTAVYVAPGTAATRGGPADTAIDAALAEASMRPLHTVELAATAALPLPRGAPVRGTAGDAGVELRVPDLGSTVRQVVLLRDAAGIVSWHFPIATDKRSDERSAVRGDAADVVFRLPRAALPPQRTDDGTRGVVAMAARQVLKVIGYRVLDPILGELTHRAVERWESGARPTALRTIDEDGALGAAWTAADSARSNRGPALLFVHGTFSRAATAFAKLPAATWAELHRRYGGRMLAFDHPSLHCSPQQNATELVALARKANLATTIDVICHSRGGLVAREIAASGGPLAVRSIVFVAAPNAGTPLADPAHMVAMIDRYTNLAVLLAPSVLGDALEAILTLVKVIGHAGLVALDGLASMHPRGAFLGALGPRDLAGVQSYAIAADYQPGDLPIARLVRMHAANALVDPIFDREGNDLVVPTAGVAAASGSAAFPINVARTLTLPPAAGVHHGSFFEHPQVNGALLDWLKG